MKDLQKSIYKEWNKLPAELASKLVWSMTNCIDDLIESKGEYILC